METQFILKIWMNEQDWADGNAVDKATWSYAHEEIADEIIPIMEQHLQDRLIYHFEIYGMPYGETYYHSMDDRH